MLSIHCGYVLIHITYTLYGIISNISLLSVWYGCGPVLNHTHNSLYREQTPLHIYVNVYWCHECSGNTPDPTMSRTKYWPACDFGPLVHLHIWTLNRERVWTKTFWIRNSEMLMAPVEWQECKAMPRRFILLFALDWRQSYKWCVISPPQCNTGWTLIMYS